MENRLSVAKPLQKERSATCVAIDDMELDRLSLLLKDVHSDNDLFRVVVNHYPGSGTGRSNVTRTHEYALFSVSGDCDLLRGEAVESGERERTFRRSGTGENNYRTGRPNSFYAVLVDPASYEIVGVEPPPDGDTYSKDPTDDGYNRVYPIGEDGSERVWTLSYEGAQTAIEEGRLRSTERLTIIRVYTDNERRNLLPSLWSDTRFSAVSYGTNILKGLFGDNSLFSYPKSLYTVDFAVEAATFDNLSANIVDYLRRLRDDGACSHSSETEIDGGADGNFSMVEVGGYFDTVATAQAQEDHISLLIGLAVCQNGSRLKQETDRSPRNHEGCSPRILRRRPQQSGTAPL